MLLCCTSLVPFRSTVSFISLMSVCGTFVSLRTIGLFVSFVFVVALFRLLVVIFFDLAMKCLQSFQIVRPSTPFSNRSMTGDTEVIHP